MSSPRPNDNIACNCAPTRCLPKPAGLTLPPRIEDVSTALTQLAAWGNLESQPDTARVSSLSDFYRARFLYRLSQGGEAVEAALALFVQTLQRRAELQTVALEDIASRLQALRTLADAAEADVAKIHETLRDLVRVFESLAENAQAFMAGVARSIELQQAEAAAVASYKRRLIDYLERFMGDLVRRSDTIASLIVALEPKIDALLQQVAEREARDAAPGDAQDRADAQTLYWTAWRERWTGLRGWFFRTGHEPSASRTVAGAGSVGDPAIAGRDRRAQRAPQRPQRPLRGFPGARRLVRRLCRRWRGAPAGARRLRTQSGTAFFAQYRRRRRPAGHARAGPTRRR